MKTIPDIVKTNGKLRPTNRATPSTERKIFVICELLTQRRIRRDLYEERFKVGERSFQRDIGQLREIGKASGFKLSEIDRSGVVKLVEMDARTSALNRDTQQLEALLATMAETFGEPVMRQLGNRFRDRDVRDNFFIFVRPVPIEGTAVADICSTLREACENRGGRAKVAFAYPEADGKPARRREVEPYHVIVRSGMYYLLGFDCTTTKRTWKLFSLNRFESKPTKIGTCTIARDVPDEYRSEDVIGFFRGSRRIDVTVELAKLVAPSAIARQWQATQRVEKLADGRAHITFVVTDIGEVFRWALGYGVDARIIAPPEAVAYAKNVSKQISAAYEMATDA